MCDYVTAKGCDLTKLIHMCVNMSTCSLSVCSLLVIYAVNEEMTTLSLFGHLSVIVYGHMTF